MEPFFDGGLFELFIAVCVGYGLNYIFQRKILLVIFSLVALAAPLVLFFSRNNELVYWMLAIALFNSVLLIVLLWKQKMYNTNNAPLFDLKKITAKFFKKKVNTAEIHNA
ncbi:MAG: hypothetical protein HY252_17110 [Sphingobacteriales bacterium]|nr:hypothetical protein [Sphingobacteriales bacterium]